MITTINEVAPTSKETSLLKKEDQVSDANCTFKKIQSYIGISLAFFTATVTLNYHSFTLYLDCRKIVSLLSVKNHSNKTAEQIQNIFKKLLQSPRSTNFWIQKNALFSNYFFDREAVLALQRIFIVSKMHINSIPKDTLLPQLSKENLKTLYDCLKFHETCEKFKTVLPLNTLLPDIQKIGKKFRLELDEFKKSSLQGGRKIFFHQRSIFGLLGVVNPVFGLKDLHVSLVENNPISGALENRHVNHLKYVHTPLRDIELIGSDIFEINIMNLISEETKKKLLLHSPYRTIDSLSFYINSIFANALRLEQEKALHSDIRNSFLTRIKTLLIHKKISKPLYQLPLSSFMQCCHFAAAALSRAIEATNETCCNTLTQKQDKSIPVVERIVNFPFDQYINPAGLTPSSLKRLLHPLCDRIRIPAELYTHLN